MKNVCSYWEIWRLQQQLLTFPQVLHNWSIWKENKAVSVNSESQHDWTHEESGAT